MMIYRSYIFSLILNLLTSQILFSQQKEPNVKPSDARGIYAIWYGEDTSILSIPYIKGGQIVLQWANVEIAEGKYDFSLMDKELKYMSDKGKWTTVQINGNQKPKWLYKKVPTHSEKLSHQIGDNEGTLMYWHPTFINAYTNFLKAYAEHLKKSKYLPFVVGVRMNFNALGTEHITVPAEKRSLDQWKVPNSVEQGMEWTEQISKDYQTKITDEYIKDFDGIKLFMRNKIPAEEVKKYQDEFVTGKLMLFHTSSEMEPRGPGAETKYDLFYKYCRNGKTLAYAEPWADAWGFHGPKKDSRWTGPSQWTYWRVLSDLNAGVSLIAVYTQDLRVAELGAQRKGVDAKQYQKQFQRAYKFGAFYAGYHASPEVSPGAWVAFRHNEKNLMTKNGLNEFTGNYTFLMKQILPDETIWKDVINVGDDSQRFGAWAKILPQGKQIKIELSELFASSLKGKPSVIKVIYFDGKPCVFQTTFGKEKIKTTMNGTGKWKTLEIPIDKSNFLKMEDGAHISFSSITGDITFHMVNVERGNGIPSDVKNVSAKFQGDKLNLKWQNSLDYDIDKIGIYKNNKQLQLEPSCENEAIVKGVSKKDVAEIKIKTIDEAGRISTGVLISNFLK
ncbi:MAG: beta-galactosidase [Flavobacteriaceae bacterium]|nr:beta-galactosidase [Flavobacteriaceae bacterium]